MKRVIVNRHPLVRGPALGARSLGQTGWLIGVAAGVVAIGFPASPAAGQNSSLYHETAEVHMLQPNAPPVPDAPRGDDGGGNDTPVVWANPAIEQVSLIAVKFAPPRKFRVHDLVTIIVRERKKFESDSELEQEKEFTISSKLEEWFRFYPGCRLGSDQLSNGDPSIKYKFGLGWEGEGEADREDKFTERITAEVVDVKPNGNLVLEAKKYVKHDEEEITLTLTGMCRSADLTPDNTILSTQVANLRIVAKHTGAVRDASRRGWIPRLLDLLRPF